MKGLIPRAAAVLCLAAGLASAGCWQWKYYQCVDPCYPERYDAMARDEVNASMAAQVNNGHVLDQTVWNWEFEPGTDKLTPGGQYELAILARRRPHPDCKIFLQTAQDVAYDPMAPDVMVVKRNDLDTRRVQSILHYLNAQTAARPVPWDVTVHDPGEVGLTAVALQAQVLTRAATFTGAMPTTFGGGGAAPAGGAAPTISSAARTGY
jgi:hypothetical protein